MTTNEELASLLANLREKHNLSAECLKDILQTLASAVESPTVSTETPIETFPIDRNIILQNKKCVVNIEQNISYALGSEKVGTFVGTGFVVDAKNGLVCTNMHLAGWSPQQTLIYFENGEYCEADVLYSDPWNDFSLYKFDPSQLDFEVSEVQLGSSFDLEEQTELILIGNNDGEEYSVKFGRVTNLHINRGDRHSYAFQASFDRTGGSSGSPVLRAKDGKVVGMHMRGTDTTSIELRIEYVIDFLKQIKRDDGSITLPVKVQRGDIGAELDHVRFSELCKHYKFPREVVNQIRDELNDENLKHGLLLYRLVSRGSALKASLRPGDCIFKVNGRVIGDNIYLFDKLIDECVGKEVVLDIYRNGVPYSVSVHVEDAEAHKIRSFALVAGGVFHDITPQLRLKLNIGGDGVFLSHVAQGSSLSDLGSGSNKHPTAYMSVIEEICGKPVPNLEAFISVFREIEANETKNIYVLARDYRSFNNSTQPHMITLSHQNFDPLRVFDYDPTTLKWKERAIQKGS